MGKNPTAAWGKTLPERIRRNNASAQKQLAMALMILCIPPVIQSSILQFPDPGHILGSVSGK